MERMVPGPEGESAQEQRYITSEDGEYLFEQFYNDAFRIAEVLNKSRMVALRDLANSAASDRATVEAMRGALEDLVGMKMNAENDECYSLNVGIHNINMQEAFGNAIKVLAAHPK
ncbi:MAG TPA: hypothetical protein VGM92_01310 [Candidatus Kapabacteria bacterium]